MSGFEFSMPPERDMQFRGDWVDRGVYKVPSHLVELYDAGRASADTLSLMADLFETVEDYEQAKATLHEGQDRDPRIDELIFRLDIQEFSGRS